MIPVKRKFAGGVKSEKGHKSKFMYPMYCIIISGIVSFLTDSANYLLSQVGISVKLPFVQNLCNITGLAKQSVLKAQAYLMAEGLIGRLPKDSSRQLYLCKNKPCCQVNLPKQKLLPGPLRQYRFGQNNAP